jgi:hypothetical protein
MCREQIQQGEVVMKIDFSNINLQYLIHFRDVAREDPDLAASLMGMSPELAELLSQVPSDYLVKISSVKIPLLTARGDALWWYRLFTALVDENSEEVEAVLRAANLSVLS